MFCLISFSELSKGSFILQTSVVTESLTDELMVLRFMGGVSE